MAYAPPVSSLVTLNVLWSRSTPTTFPSPGPRMIGTVVSVSGRNLPIGSISNPVARAQDASRVLSAPEQQTPPCLEAVIRGPGGGRTPESITTGWEYRFRARRYA